MDAVFASYVCVLVSGCILLEEAFLHHAHCCSEEYGGKDDKSQACRDDDGAMCNRVIDSEYKTESDCASNEPSIANEEHLLETDA